MDALCGSIDRETLTLSHKIWKPRSGRFVLLLCEAAAYE